VYFEQRVGGRLTGAITFVVIVKRAATRRQG
jgi:hypothetical protein